LTERKKIKLVDGGKLLKETRFEIDPWVALSHLNQDIATSWASLLNFGETSLCVFIVACLQFSLFDFLCVLP